MAKEIELRVKVPGRSFKVAPGGWVVSVDTAAIVAAMNDLTHAERTAFAEQVIDKAWPRVEKLRKQAQEHGWEGVYEGE